MRFATKRLPTILLVLVLLLLPVTTEANTVNYVIHVSVDGLRGDLLQGLLADDIAEGTNRYPSFQRLRQEGAFTFNARTDTHLVNTLPNHTTILTGRPVLRTPGQPRTAHHGYFRNDTPSETTTVHNRGNRWLDYAASVFDVVHDQGLGTSLYASKSKFSLYDQSYNQSNGAPDRTGANNGRDKIDVYVNNTNTPALTRALTQNLRAAPTAYTFFHIRDPDSAGHDRGWGSAAWNNAVASTDRHLGRVLAAIDGDPELAGKTTIVLTSDHGGNARSHASPLQWRNYTIPFFVWGADYEPGGDLYDVFDVTRRDPGRRWVSYNAWRQPIRNGESGNLALSLLGLPEIPGSTIGTDHFPRISRAALFGSAALPVAAAVPEPSNFALGILSLAGFALLAWRRQTR